MMLEPGGYALILELGYWNESEQIYAGRVPPGTLLLAVEDGALGSGGLMNNVPETVQLLDADSVTVSRRRYVAGAENGRSEERIQPEGGQSDDNWSFSARGGTPGYFNSVTPLENDLAIDDSVRIYYEHSMERWASEVGFLVINLGSEVAGLNRTLTAQLGDEGGVVYWEHEYQLTSLLPGERFAAMDIVYLAGGRYSLMGHLRPSDDRPFNDTLSVFFRMPEARGSVAIVEVMADPPSHTDFEWIELQSFSDVPMPLAGWSFEDATGSRARLDSTAPVLMPDSLILLAPDSALLAWPNLPAGAQLSVPTGWPSLNNSGDSLSLYDAAGSLIDLTGYSSVREGVALQRVLGSSGDVTPFWTQSPDPSGATPGRVNPIVPQPGEVKDPVVTLTPQVIKADGDGRDETITFGFTFPVSTLTVTLYLYDRIGRPVGTLLNSRMLPGVSEWVWDGRQGLQGDGLPLGIYVWHLRAEDSSGSRSWELKGTLVSAGY
jgi:hypothetical protein